MNKLNRNSFTNIDDNLHITIAESILNQLKHLKFLQYTTLNNQLHNQLLNILIEQLSDNILIPINTSITVSIRKDI
jgi:hypothetical protein